MSTNTNTKQAAANPAVIAKEVKAKEVAITKAERAARTAMLEAVQASTRVAETYVIRAIRVRALFDSLGGRDRRGVGTRVAKYLNEQMIEATGKGVARPTVLKWYDDSVALEQAGLLSVSRPGKESDDTTRERWEAAVNVVAERYGFAAEVARVRRAEAKQDGAGAADNEGGEDTAREPEPSEGAGDALTVEDVARMLERARNTVRVFVAGGGTFGPEGEDFGSILAEIGATIEEHTAR